MDAELDLATLLAAALDDLVRCYRSATGYGPPLPPLDLWANLLRVVGMDGVAAGEVPRLTRLSRRAARTRLQAAVSGGWLDVSGRGTAARVALTASGVEVVARWRDLETRAETSWRDYLGPARHDRLRVAATAFVASLPLEHPHHPARYGTADASVTGGPGTDWKPVPRRPGRDPAGEPGDDRLSMCALLSQALTDYAIAFEEVGPLALATTRSIVLALPPDGSPSRGFPRSDLSTLERHGFLVRDGSGARERVTLTARGRAVRDAYPEHVRAVEQLWRDQFGAGTVNRLRAALAAVGAGPVEG